VQNSILIYLRYSSKSSNCLIFSAKSSAVHGTLREFKILDRYIAKIPVTVFCAIDLQNSSNWTC